MQKQSVLPARERIDSDSEVPYMGTEVPDGHRRGLLFSAAVQRNADWGSLCLPRCRLSGLPVPVLCMYITCPWGCSKFESLHAPTTGRLSTQATGHTQSTRCHLPACPPTCHPLRARARRRRRHAHFAHPRQQRPCKRDGIWTSSHPDHQITIPAFVSNALPFWIFSFPPLAAVRNTACV